jgi:hypothetical protein
MKKGGLNVGSIIGIVVAVIGLLIGGVMIYISSTANKRMNVNLGVMNEGKTYLFSDISTDSFKSFNSDNPNSAPTIVKSSTIIFIDDEVYVEPKELDKIINLASENYTLFSRERKKYDGFVTINNENNNTFSRNEIIEEGGKIGEQVKKSTIEIKNERGDLHSIRWSILPNDEIIAEENCIITSIRLVDNWKPGATSYYSEDVVVIKLKTVLEFLNNGLDYKSDLENEILYINQ